MSKFKFKGLELIPQSSVDVHSINTTEQLKEAVHKQLINLYLNAKRVEKWQVNGDGSHLNSKFLILHNLSQYLDNPQSALSITADQIKSLDNYSSELINKAFELSVPAVSSSMTRSSIRANFSFR